MSGDVLNIEFSFVTKPADSSARLRNRPPKQSAMATTSDLCLKCPNALLCISGRVELSNCRKCNRVYVNDSEIPADITCEGFSRQPLTAHPTCRVCDGVDINYKIQEYLREAVAPLIGYPITPATLHQAKEALKHRAQQILLEHGWNIEVSVECEET